MWLCSVLLQKLVSDAVNKMKSGKFMGILNEIIKAND